MSNTNTVRVLIADDHPMVLEGLSAVLECRQDVQVVAQATNGQEALDLFHMHQPDVTLLDLRMPGVDGVEVITALRSEFPDVRVIVFSSFDSDEDVYASVRAGARAYLLKDASVEELLQAVHGVARGETLLTPAIAAKFAARMSRRELTKREAEVLHLIAAGKSNYEIGAALFVCEGTIKSHVNSILSKLEVNDRTQAVVVSIKRGLVRLD